MSGAKFAPAVDVIRPKGGAARISYTGGGCGQEPAIKIEVFRKAGESGTRIGKVVISTCMLWPVLNAMIDAGTRAIDEAQGIVPTGDGRATSLDVAAVMAGG
ncbi:MAG: hypothetical protein KAF42_01700, partial [Sphingopyxis terrae]|nr:hypothetical protein [Sphingopyxis terrae]